MRALGFPAMLMLLFGCATVPSVSEPEPLGPTGGKLSVIGQSPQVAAFFKGTFDALNFTVAESGERFYFQHTGDRIEVKGGKFGGADLDVAITRAQVDAIGQIADRGALNDQDAFDIMRVLFSPIARAFIRGSFLANPIILQMAGLEDNIQVIFFSEGRADSSTVTLLARGRRWDAVDGLEGQPKRVFRLNPTETAEYMRRVHTTRKSQNPKAWIDFVNWYRHWRDRVSFVPAAA